MGGKSGEVNQDNRLYEQEKESTCHNQSNKSKESSCQVHKQNLKLYKEGKVYLLVDGMTPVISFKKFREGNLK